MIADAHRAMVVNSQITKTLAIGLVVPLRRMRSVSSTAVSRDRAMKSDVRIIGFLWLLMLLSYMNIGLLLLVNIYTLYALFLYLELLALLLVLLLLCSTFLCK